MEKKFIEEEEFDKCLKLSSRNLYETYEYLKDKRSVIQFGQVEVPNAHLYFLEFALGRNHYVPEYSSKLEMFLKSDFIAKKLKEEFCYVIGDDCSFNQVTELINSDKLINDFSKEEILLLYDSLFRIFNITSNPEIKKRCSDVEYVLRQYLFILDGEGPVSYIKEKYKDKLPILIIEQSGLSSSPTYYSGDGIDRSLLSDKHLFSIYKKYVKYYPDKADEFVNMVNNIECLTPTEFLTNYLLFVQNGMDSNFKRRVGNVNLEHAPKMLGGFLGIATAFSSSKNEYKDEYYEWKKVMDAKTQEEIKKLFLENVEQYKKDREGGYKKS